MRASGIWSALASRKSAKARCRKNGDSSAARLRTAVGFAIEPMEQRLLLAGNVVISEFMADNSTGIKDFYGQNSDWIELHNLDSTPRDLSGWHLTDSASNLTECTFPTGTSIAAGGILVVFASGRDIKTTTGELHTNFKLSPAGEYLGLTDASANIVSQYNPVYPAQYADVSYGMGTQLTSTTLVGPGASGKWLVPATAGDLDPNWAANGFVDSSWTAGTTGLGFDTSAASLGDFAVVEAHGASALANITDGINLILNGTGVVTKYAPGTINFVDPQNPATGHFTGNANFGGDTAADDNNFALRVRGTIHITTPGQYTFGVNSDDGFSLSINGTTFSSLTNCSNTSGGATMEFAGTRGAADSFGVTTLAAGNYDIDLHYFAATGTSHLEFFAASGAKTAFDSSFKLVGDTANGGLPLVKVADQLASNPAFQSAAQSVNASAFLRIPFNVADPADIAGLTLRMKYDDGFVAYLNGEEIARSNAPDTPVWNSTATADHATGESVRFEDFNISDDAGFLVQGTNVLSIQGLNTAANDANFLLLPQLDMQTTSQAIAGLRYFVNPTPRAANGSGAVDLGPIVTDVSSPAVQPGDNDPIVVTAKVKPAANPLVGSPTLVYRVMYNAEQSLPMFDDGLAGGHGDAKAGDGVWTGTIPANTSTPGQMVRWYVTATDTLSQVGRWPVLVPLVGNDAGPEYVGTVIADPTVTSTMPIFTYFTSDVTGSNGGGARGSVFYMGEFYDNVFIRHRGANSTQGNKFEFNSGYDFKYADDRERVKEIDVNNRGALDDAYIRPVIGFETFRDAGAAALTAFPMRIQLNGAFSRVALFLEQVDDRMLEQNGLYANGAVYKMASDNPQMNNAGSMEKKNRDEETSRADLSAFFTGIHLTGVAQTKFLYDNVNIPEMLDYIAANILTGDEDDAQKNYFLYRDTNDGSNAFYNFANPLGTNEWSMLPWDKDLTYGKNYSTGDYAAKDPQTHPFFPSQGHPKIDSASAYLWLTDALLKVPAIKEMYLRRLRTIMDEMLQPPGTPVKNRYYETRLDELFAELTGDPTALASMGNLTTAFNNLKTLYLDPRRTHLYIDHSVNTAYPDFANIPAQQNGSPTINFGAYDSSPASGNQDEEYLQLVNPNSTAVDISGWRLIGGVNLTFDKGVVIPAGGTLYVSPNVFAFRNRAGRSPTAIEFVEGNYTGHLSRTGEIVTLVDPSGKTISFLTTASAPSAAQQSLRVTEIMYHPQDPPAGSPFKNDDFEYIEVKNIGATTLSLTGVKFTDGVYFSFTGSNVQSLAPGGFALVVGNLAAFQSRYGHSFDSIVAGVFSPAPGATSPANLDNGGEHIRLADSTGETILAFDYKDSWFTQTDGLGNSLVSINPNADVSQWDSSEGWTASLAPNGSPGIGDAPAIGPRTVVINEILTNTTADPRGQWIELLNTTPGDIDISGWYLSNDGADLKKYRIAAGTIIPAGGFATFTQISNFGNAADPGDLKTFTLDPTGGSLYLTSASGTDFSGYQASEKYSAAAKEVTFGRYITSTEKDFVAMTTPTFGAANTAPATGPVVINEVMYHPPIGGDEFVELKNLTGAAVNLFDPANPKNTWKLSEGIEFTFPAGASIPANGYALIVKTSPAFFRAKYNIPAAVPIFGPYLNGLDNDHDTVELKRPGDPPSPGATAPYIRVDQVSYSDSVPWPVSADGRGTSLNRITPAAYGDDVVNWQAGRGTPGAAFASFDTTPPPAPNVPTLQINSATKNTLTWNAVTDPQSGVAFYFIYANGNRMAASTFTTYTDNSASSPPRNYQISAVNNDGVESTLSTPVLSAFITPVTPDPRNSPVSQVTISFNGPVTGLDLSDFTLKLNGGANLLTASQTLTTSDNITFTLGNLASLTGASGSYVLTLKAAGSGITDNFSQTLLVDSVESWTADQTAPTVTITPVSPDPRVTTADQITIVFSEATANFDLSDLTLKRNGGANLLTAAQTLTSNDGITWTLGNLGNLTNIAGTYQLTLIAGPGVTDLAGNALAAGASDSWVMSITSQTPFDTTDDGLGTVTAQGENGPGEGKLKAFDNTTSTKWLDFANANPTTRASWIQYQYASGQKYIVTQYTISSANDAPERDPRDWQLLGSNDGGANWTIIDSRTGETFANRLQKKTYTATNSVAYNIYRLNILSVAGPGANSVQLSEIELIGFPAPPPPTVVSANFDAAVTQSLSFHFSQSVQQSLNAADIKIHNLTTNQDITPLAPVYDQATDTATFSFATLPPDGNYTATLNATGITDQAGSQLDGDANGTGGDSYTFNFFVFAGDADHDRTIGFADLVALAQHYGQTGGATAATGDANDDGNVDFADLVLVGQKYGTSLPAPAAVPAPVAAAIPVAAPVTQAPANPAHVAAAPVPAMITPVTSTKAVPVAPKPVIAAKPIATHKVSFSVVPISKPAPPKPVVARPPTFSTLQKKRESLFDNG